MKNFLVLFLIFSLSIACSKANPNSTSQKKMQTQLLKNAKFIVSDSSIFKSKIYVPIYSDIYQRSEFEKTLLTATLSIRNTSEYDSLYLGRVDYFNTKGSLVTKFLKDTIFLYPLETIDYVIEERDTLGGSGANFIVEWYGKENLTPVLQAVMIGGLGTKSFSFTTQGTLVRESNDKK
jgi:hypothetical protein